MTLTPRTTDYSARYNELIEHAQIAQHSAVHGCMVIRPYGYAIRENMQKILDDAFKKTGHHNAYFPLFIPKSFFTKEAKHVEHFATEAAIVTHYRMKRDETTGEIIVDSNAKLDEELIVRPTSETIIWHTFKDWITSYRDLPLFINQWANVVRQEMRTRYFLRTAEFLRQEGHTAHASADDTIQKAERMRHVYNEFLTKVLALDGVMGVKTENEKFAGGETTYTIECMMQNGKAIQSCISHFLWQNFRKAFDVQFTNKDNQQEYAQATSRGMSTRSYDAMIMAHDDNKELVLPPAIAPIHIMIVPIAKNESWLAQVQKYLSDAVTSLEKMTFKIGNESIDSHIQLLSIADAEIVARIQYQALYIEKNNTAYPFDSFVEDIRSSFEEETWISLWIIVNSTIQWIVNGMSMSAIQRRYGQDYIHQWIKTLYPTMQDIFMIDSLSVQKQYRKHWFGKQLVNTIEQHIQQKGYKKIVITVDNTIWWLVQRYERQWYLSISVYQQHGMNETIMEKQLSVEKWTNDAVIAHISPTHPPKPELETKSRNRVCAIIKHPTDKLFMVLYTKGTTKLHVLFGGWLDEGEDRETCLRRKLLEKTGYHNIASMTQLGWEHHWINVGDDELYNYCSKQRCFVVQLASLDQQPISHHEQSLHDIL